MSLCAESVCARVKFSLPHINFSADVIIITQQLDIKHAKKGFFATANSLWREEGIKAFGKGLWTSIVQQYLDDKVRSYLRRLVWASTPNLLPPLALESLVSALAHVVVYPLQAIRTRLIAQTGTSKYTGVFDCFVRVREEEGDAALVTQGLFTAVVHAVLTMVVSSYSTMWIVHPVLRSVATQHSWMVALPLATIATELITFPVSTITKRMQLQNPNLPKSMRPRVTGSATEIISRSRKEQGGAAALWSGFSGVVLRSFAVSATMGLAVMIDDVGSLLRDFYSSPNALAWSPTK